MPSHLIEIPPHGDLIDRDAVYKAINDARKEDPLLEDVYVDDYVIVSDWLRNAPTIIPANINYNINYKADEGE